MLKLQMSLNFRKSRSRCLLLSKFVQVQPLSPVRSGRWRQRQLLTASSGLGTRRCFPSTAMTGLSWVFRTVLRPLEWVTRGIQGFQTQKCSLAPQGRDTSTVQQDQVLNHKDISHQRESVGLAGAGGGWENHCGSACPFFPPSSSWRGVEGRHRGRGVFRSSHRPKIAAGFNAGFLSHHFLLIICIKANHHPFTTEQDRNAEQNCQVAHLTSRV